MQCFPVSISALDYLFDTLKTHGRTFPPEFWDSVCKEVLFPIFAVLRSRQDVSRFSTHEDMSVWLSTTMIQALRDLVDLFAHYFDVLVRMLDQLLDLLVECICQGETRYVYRVSNLKDADLASPLRGVQKMIRLQELERLACNSYSKRMSGS